MALHYPNPPSVIKLRQDKVEEYMASGIRPITIAKLMNTPLRTIKRDVRAVLDRWNADEAAKNPFKRKEENLNAMLSRLRRDRERAEVLLEKAISEKNSGLIRSLTSHIRELEKTMADIMIKSGRLPNVPQETITTVQTGKEFVVRWKKEGEK